MKKILFLILIAVSFTGYSQTITSTNYYDHFSIGKNLKGTKLVTAWVTKFEVAKILEEEMDKAGFEWISTFRIVQISDNMYVNSICFSEKSKVGFLFEAGHSAFPKAAEKGAKSKYKLSTGIDYAEKIVRLDKESEFIKIKEVPSNFFILKEEPYWYQYTDNLADNKVLVTKEIILEILRNDIRTAISNFKK